MIPNVPKLIYHAGDTFLDFSFLKSALKFAQTSTRVFNKQLEGSRFADVVKMLCKPKFMHLIGALSFAKSAVDCCKKLYLYEYYKKESRRNEFGDLVYGDKHYFSYGDLSYDVTNLAATSLDLFSLRKILSQAKESSGTHHFLEKIPGPVSIIVSAVDYRAIEKEFKGIKDKTPYYTRARFLAQTANIARFASGIMLTAKWMKDIKSPGFGRALDIMSMTSIAFNYIAKVNASYRSDATEW